MLTFEQPLLLLLFVPVAALIFFAWRRTSLPFPKRQRWLILGSRLLLFALIISALAGAAWSQPISRQAVVFVGDISASTTPQRAFIEQWITSALRHRGPDDQVGIVAVGRNALVEQSMRSQIDFSHFQSTPDTNYTDLAAGLRLAAAILPTDSERRIVLLTDGQQNLEDALQEAQLLQQQGIRLDIVPLPTVNGPDARIDGLNAPENLHTNERFLLRTRLYSTVAEKATLRLYLDQTLLTQQSIQLTFGQQEVDFNVVAPPPGFHTYRVTLDAPVDSVLQNNEAATFVNVQGPPHVLIVEGQPGEGHNIAAALKATGINVTIGTPNDIPISLEGLAGYSSVILANVPAIELGTERMQILQAYVRDLGRGLVVSGGQNSYGVGGYANTPLEQTLPVSMQIPQHKDTPSIAVVLIIESLESDAEVNISKEAAKGVISLLTPRDQVGISAAYGSLVVPMQHVTNKSAINHAIDAMDPNDPASYLPDLVNAESVLLKSNAKIKHVILLGDGDAFDSYGQQVIKMASEQITVSTVATNSQSFQELGTMQQIATWGKGRFYRADDPTTIPQILLKETQQAARRAVINESFTPETVGSHPILTGLGPLPILNGYVATTPKPAAQLVLVSHLDDPVLAVWQYGLGRVAAWTSDALGLWTGNWLRWSNAARWWANVVTWTLPSSQSALDVNATVVNGTGQLTVDLPPGTPTSSNGQQAQVHIIAPDLSQATLPLQPTAPGRWQGNFPAGQVGAYLLQVTWQGQSKGISSRLSATTGLVVPYSPEYRSSGTDTRFLTLLARAGGGSLLGPNSTSAAFSSNLPPVSAAIPIIFLLLAIAALLLPIDIALRRLSSLEFLVLGYQWLLAHLKRRTPQLAAEAAQLSGTALGSTLGNLRTQRAERRTRLQSAKPRTGASPLDSLQKPTRQEAQPPTRREKAEQKTEEISTTEKLLEAKRSRAQKRSSKEGM
ncbi:MAG TPA: glutamine amidotransferase [Ktedonobacteraceae bacterium]|nr:glutamine amidotransferase [Ktedonobacteraceae bacterium]